MSLGRNIKQNLLKEDKLLKHTKIYKRINRIIKKNLFYTIFLLFPFDVLFEVSIDVLINFLFDFFVRLFRSTFSFDIVFADFFEKCHNLLEFMFI